MTLTRDINHAAKAVITCDDDAWFSELMSAVSQPYSHDDHLMPRSSRVSSITDYAIMSAEELPLLQFPETTHRFISKKEGRFKVTNNRSIQSRLELLAHL